MLTDTELYEFLEERHNKYNQPNFVETDPIQIPHRFSLKEDIEIAAFLTAAIAWGNRTMIIRNADRMVQLMGNSPFDFVMNVNDVKLERLQSFVHRTFNATDLVFFLKSLKNIYANHQGLEQVFTTGFAQSNQVFDAIAHFRKVFFEIEHPGRTQKHISNVEKKAAAKRINMFLMWLVRNDNRGVHFGLWQKIPSSALMLPLDVHTARVGRGIGLLTRTQNDRQAVEEITESLKKFDANDPVKY
ncbi:MAG TPA: TIGR02757 family protein, partial [Bacteroidales bacterium]|nr:TIGR02757 family protein [Bacteroidales bacterium]